MRRLGKKKSFIDSSVGFSPYSVETDKLDIRFFEEIKNENPKIKKTLEDMKGVYDPFTELEQDIFSALYRYKPKLLKEYKVKSTHLLNREVMKEVMQSPKYKELRALTQLDQINSTIGTEVLGYEASNLVKKLKEQQKALEKLQGAMGDMQNQGKADKNKKGKGAAETSEKHNDGGTGQKVKSVNKLTMEEAKKKLEQARKEFKASMKKKEVVSGVRQALNEAQNIVTETSNMIQNWGLGGEDTFTRKPYHEKMELLKKLRENRKLKQIAELAGRFKRIATQRQREKVKKGLDEIYDVSLGKNLNRLLPSELVKLRTENTKKQFYKDFSEGKLLQYELRGKEKKQRGAIVVCIDESGSMSGTPEIWSKAVAMALLEVAIYQKRSFYCIHFDHTRDPNKLHTNEFPKDQPKNIMEVINMAEYFSGS